MYIYVCVCLIPLKIPFYIFSDITGIILFHGVLHTTSNQVC